MTEEEGVFVESGVDVRLEDEEEDDDDGLLLLLLPAVFEFPPLIP